MLAAARMDSSSRKDPLVTACHLQFVRIESMPATPKEKCQCLMDMAAADALVVEWRNQEVQTVLEAAKDPEVEVGASSA